jgi:uncharacterized integral membrane protein
MMMIIMIMIMMIIIIMLIIIITNNSSTFQLHKSVQRKRGEYPLILNIRIKGVCMQSNLCSGRFKSIKIPVFKEREAGWASDPIWPF